MWSLRARVLGAAPFYWLRLFFCTMQRHHLFGGLFSASPFPRRPRARCDSHLQAPRLEAAPLPGRGTGRMGRMGDAETPQWKLPQRNMMTSTAAQTLGQALTQTELGDIYI